MGLSALAFVAAVGMVVVILLTLRRGLATTAIRYELALDLVLLFVTVSQAMVILLYLDVQHPAAYLFWARAVNASIALSEFLLVAFALYFPRRIHRRVRFAALFLLPVAAYALSVILGSADYLREARFGGAGFALTPGAWFDWMNLATAGMGMAAAVIHLVRGMATDDSINRQRSFLAFLGVLVGVGGLVFMQGYGMAHSQETWPSLAIPFVALVTSVMISYAISISRLFDWRELLKTLFAYLVIAVVIGVPTGAIVALLVILGAGSPLVPIVGSFFLFIAANRLGRNFKARFFERLGARLEYREMLESALAHIDLSQGRDAVLADLNALLTDNLGFSDFTILIEDDHAVLKTTWSSANGHANMDRSDLVRNFIERTNVNVLMLSEAQADAAYEGIQKELLALFGSLKAEVLIFAREGRRIIGVFAIGARKIGGEYTDYDYETFKAICAKLFVFAFYLKNVARESIFYTVDRELALSDQVIRFALEHVASVEHPRADAAWAMRSTRSLGGDFVDFVKMGKERWFFVLGDISGKGLSASMNMLILKSMVRTFLRIEKDFAGLVQRVNAFIKDHLPKGSFFAGVFGYFDFERGILYFINCGVPAILLYSPSFDAFIEVQGEGKVLGFVRDISPYLKPRKISLSPGTALVVCTDGLLDSENIRGERFGKERLRKSSRDRLQESAKAIADGVLEDLLRYTENRQEDDITLLVMKIK